MSAEPMSPNFFHCPPLSRDTQQRFQDLGVAAAIELAENAQLCGGPIDWKLESNEDGLKLFKGKVAGTKYESFPATPRMFTIQVMGTMPEIFDLFRSQTTEESKQYCRRFGNASEDAVNLYSIVPVTPETPHEMIGISWRGLKPAMDKLVMRRDACLLVVHHAFEFNGKPVWVRCLKSIAMPCCPELPGFVRMSINCSGYLFYESDRPGYLDVSLISHVDMNGTLGEYAQWLIDLSLKKRWRSLIEIDRFLRENRLSKTPFLRPEETKPVALARACHLCLRRFGLLSKRINCLKCGEVCCRRCIREWEVKNRGFDARANVCTMCSLGKPGERAASELWRSSSRLQVVSSSGSEGQTTPASQESTVSSPLLFSL
ncbi:hypothetical protein Ae201684_008873 [Aphanomyces euteiches]|uniref:FYVE-type domain-containing protein n=1 Tax=Aphanomyces euteiches TaxID=100861 RepID=A0A6G0X3P7_9STRA|nr:hypothetical protein Ae201684_008873 [Aphanomyces euteiches]KAH9152171.1 hypothetical protein AeRB84_005357 [Aphanomyces euteiches]